MEIVRTLLVKPGSTNTPHACLQEWIPGARLRLRGPRERGESRGSGLSRHAALAPLLGPGPCRADRPGLLRLSSVGRARHVQEMGGQAGQVPRGAGAARSSSPTSRAGYRAAEVLGPIAVGDAGDESG